MAALNRNGVDLYYEVHGKGPAILLSHGYSASCEMWRGQIEALSRDHTLIVWDMRGHGRSDSPGEPEAYSEAVTVADMARLLDAAGSGRAVVGGLSLGGYMSLAFRLAHPDRVSALMMFDTGPGFRKDEAREAWNARALRTAERVGNRGLALAARGMLAQKDSRVIDSLPAIAVPSLVLVGADDTSFLASTDYMAAKIPAATKVVIANAGHVANIDQPAAFNQAVLCFLAGVRAG